MMGGMKVSISLPDELGVRLDAFRGDVPRSVFVRRAVERALDGSQQDVALKGAASGEMPAGSPPPGELPVPSVAGGLSAFSGGFSAKLQKEPGDEWAVSDRELVERYLKPLSRTEAFKRATQR